MATEIGRLVNVGLGRESVGRGTPAAAAFWLPKVEFDFDPKAELAVDNSGLGVIDGRSDAKVVEQLGEGSFGGVVYDKTFGILLAACLGTWSSVGPSDSGYTHSFTRLNSNQHPSLTIYHKDQNVEERFPLGMLSQLSIKMALKDYVRYTAGFMSKIGVTTTGNTPSYISENAFLATHATIKFADTVAALGTASDVGVRAVNLTINKNVEDWQNLGSTDPADIVNKALFCSGDFELLFDDVTYRDYVLAGTKKAARLTLENTDVAIGTATHPKMQITFAPLTLKDWGRGVGQDDIASQTIAFDGNFGFTSSKTLDIVLVNTQTSY